MLLLICNLCKLYNIHKYFSEIFVCYGNVKVGDFNQKVSGKTAYKEKGRLAVLDNIEEM